MNSLLNPVIAGMIGGWEIIAILAIVLLLFGGSKLPELAKGLGKSIKEFKKASAEAEDFHPPALLRRVLRVGAAVARRSRDSRIMRYSGVLMRILHDARAGWSVSDENRTAIFIEADESGSILQSRIGAY